MFRCGLVFVCVLCQLITPAHADGLSVGVLIDTGKNLTALNLSASNSSVLSNSTVEPLVPVVGVVSCANPPCPDLTLAQLGAQLVETFFKPPIPNITITTEDDWWTRFYSSNDHMNVILIGGGLALLAIFVGATASCFHNSRGNSVKGAFTRPQYRKVLAVQLVRAV